MDAEEFRRQAAKDGTPIPRGIIDEDGVKREHQRSAHRKRSTQSTGNKQGQRERVEEDRSRFEGLDPPGRQGRQREPQPQAQQRGGGGFEDQGMGGLEALLSLGRRPPESSPSELEAGLRPLVSDEKMTLMSDLHPSQIRAVAKGLYFSERWHCEDLKLLIQRLLECAVSKSRGGRSEYVQAAMYRPPEMAFGGGMEPQGSWLDRFRGE